MQTQSQAAARGARAGPTWQGCLRAVSFPAGRCPYSQPPPPRVSVWREVLVGPGIRCGYETRHVASGVSPTPHPSLSCHPSSSDSCLYGAYRCHMQTRAQVASSHPGPCRLHVADRRGPGWRSHLPRSPSWGQVASLQGLCSWRLCCVAQRGHPGGCGTERGAGWGCSAVSDVQER